MPEEQLKAFLGKVKGDTSLQDKLKAAKSPEDVVAIAKEHGYDFGTEHISELSKEGWRVYLVAHLLPPLTPGRDAIHYLASRIKYQLAHWW